ncbi:MAG: 1-deoxy-D-xylulose-5-phosphate reductoisomerase [Nitrospirae bacterium]|nr:1-deoxy-D-xylulose-5-phosphate reductoisomerase [Nitrospirota bacterium]
MGTKRLVILGSTGSIGTATLDLVADFPDLFEVVGLAAGRGGDALERQIRRFKPRVVSVSRTEDADRLRAACADLPVDILGGPDAAATVAAQGDGDLVVSAIVGAAGLVPTLAAIRAGKSIALANKETMVMAGALVTAEAARRGVSILPIDSEHSAIFQALSGQRAEDVRRLILTASGGPFWDVPRHGLDRVTREDALRHPNWSMGPKITVDSATLMNKGLEVIEAHWLFGMPADRIDVVIHRQSVVHSLVEYCDGSMLAQMGIPDMRGPIGYALAYPRRLPLRLPPLDLAARGALTFEPPDPERFPCLEYGYEALKTGGTAPAVLNAANEEAVAAFLDGRVEFLAIADTIERVLSRSCPGPATTLDDVLQADRWARAAAREVLGRSPAATLSLGDA